MSIYKKLKPIIEILVVNSILWFLFYRINPNPKTYFEMNPHPLLLVTIGFSLFYKNKVGIITTLISTSIYTYLFYDAYGSLSLYLSGPKYFKYPLLFLWVGSAVGIVVEYHVTDKESIANDYETLLHEFTSLEYSYYRSKKAAEELREQIIQSDTSIIALYDIAKRLKVLNREEIFTETVAILSKYLKANDLSLYSYNNKSDYLRLKLNIGNTNSSLTSVNLKDHIDFKRVIEHREVLRYSDAKAKDFPILSGPIVLNNEVIGIVNIVDMDFDKISNYAYILFKVILDWISLSIENTKAIEELRDDRYHKRTQVMKFDAFKQRFKSEERRRQEYGLDYCMITLKCYETPLLRSQSIKSIVRDMDVVSFYEDKIYILLPATSKTLYSVVKGKILSRIDFDIEVIEH